jgi:hypothetical protein
MTRRRLILAACVAVVALGAAWWWYVDRLTAEERQLVGKWQLNSGPNGIDCLWTFQADRQTEWNSWQLPGRRGRKVALNGQWAVHDGLLNTEYETSPLRRALRPIIGRFWSIQQPVVHGSIEFESTDSFTVSLQGKRQSWTRVRGD